MGFGVKLNKSIERIIKGAGICDDTLMFAAGEARKLMNDYVPMKTGLLADSAEIFAENGKGRVYYPQIYASVCYYGENRKFNSEKHQKATAFWDRAMMQTHKSDLAGSVGNYIKKKG